MIQPPRALPSALDSRRRLFLYANRVFVRDEFFPRLLRLPVESLGSLRDRARLRVCVAD